MWQSASVWFQNNLKLWTYGNENVNEETLSNQLRHVTLQYHCRYVYYTKGVSYNMWGN